MPIYKAVATETEIMSCTEKRHVQTGNNPITLKRHNARLEPNNRRPVFILTPFIFRYHLPLNTPHTSITLCFVSLIGRKILLSVVN
jgi:hypothetical protein